MRGMPKLSLVMGMFMKAKFRRDKLWVHYYLICRICLGQGAYHYVNGEKYFGMVNNGVETGNGIYMWPDGRKYEGNFENGVPHGNGTYWWPDGVVYSGAWKDGLQHGNLN